MIWKLNASEKINGEIDKLPLHHITKKLLAQRGFKTADQVKKFFSPDYLDLYDPTLISGIEPAGKRIFQAIKKKQKILIYGDYDADGITAVVLLYDVLVKLGANVVGTYIPDRNKEGYGLNREAIDFIVKEYGPNLIITVDCGIGDVDEVAYASDLAIDVIITDHHIVPEKVPKKAILVNPKINPSYPGSVDLAGVGVAFKLSYYLYKILSPERVDELKWLLDLVAIGTVADCVPLIGENRILVKFGLIVLQKTKRIGLQEMLKVARLVIDEKNPPNAWNIAFQIAPRLNAAGRMDHADLTVKLLLEKRRDQARIMALELEEKNNQRQKMAEVILSEVEERLAKKEKSLIIAESGTNWPIGMLGVVAGKLAEKHCLPTFLFREKENLMIGSGRSVEGINIVDVVSKIQHDTLRFGGHAMAMGLKVKKEKFSIFINKLENLIGREIDENKPDDVLYYDAELEMEEIDWDLYYEIKKFEPFGEGNNEPIFFLRNAQVEEVCVVGNNGKHIKFYFCDKKNKNRRLEGIFFRQGSLFEKIEKRSFIDIIFKLRASQWSGTQKLELHLIDILFQ